MFVGLKMNLMHCNVICHHIKDCFVCVCMLLTGNSGLGPTLASGMLPLPMPRASILKVKAATPRPLPAMAAKLLTTCSTAPTCPGQLHCQTRVCTASECTTVFIAFCLTLPPIKRYKTVTYFKELLTYTMNCDTHYGTVCILLLNLKTR